jgi:formylglycine-generating enzyme required for sulfatase activity
MQDTPGIAGGSGFTNVAGAAGSGPVWTGCFCGTPGCGECPTNLEVDVGGYWIDALEVSNSEYLAFLSSDPDPASQPSVCSWNWTYLPDGDWPLLDEPDRPVTWIDWCDAYAYCAWAGKRLCGAIGGGPSPVADSDNALVNQWYNACSSGGQNDYPYGNTYDRFACNGSDFGWGATLRSGALLTCATGTGIYDMSGNVYEWEDSCSASTGGLDVCLARGGSFYTSNPAYLDCESATSLYERRSVRGSLGFRCCRDSP